jgi:hypothetical protein
MLLLSVYSSAPVIPMFNQLADARLKKFRIVNINRDAAAVSDIFIFSRLLFYEFGRCRHQAAQQRIILRNVYAAIPFNFFKSDGQLNHPP